LGPLARGVEDCALILSAIHGADALDPTAADIPFIWDANAKLKSLRVGFQKTAFDEVAKGKDEQRRKIYGEAMEVIRSLVGEMQPISLPPTKLYTGVAGLR